jgi:hypothetical protein
LRKDMAKVIVERPRRHGGETFRSRRNELKAQLNSAIRADDFDNIYSRESHAYWASRGLGYDRKELNENLNPLRRYLRAQVGRDWDTVFSEMCDVMDVRNACQFHIWQHARDYVEHRTFIGDDGKVWYADDYCGFFSRRNEKGVDQDWHRPIEESLAEVYVVPGKGTLALVPERPRYRSRKPQYDYVKIDQWNQAHKIGEHWFWIELDRIPVPYWKPWTLMERERMQAELMAERTAKYGFWAYNSDRNKHKRSATGRWIYPTFQDCALYSILQSWRGEEEKKATRYSYNAYDYDSRSGEMIYGRKGVYARRRWQMNSDELRRWVFPFYPPLSCEPEVIK